MVALLVGCAVKPLKAPCSRDEGETLTMSYGTKTQRPAAIVAFDQCGPMQAVNQ